MYLILKRNTVNKEIAAILYHFDFKG